jgi:membrane-bound lytic murein transglycosylase MltF
LNRKYARKLRKRAIDVIIIPTPQDRLLSDVADGFGDIAMGNLTITQKRQAVLDFVPIAKDALVREIVVTGPGGPPVANTDGLSGKTVHVRGASSYYESLKQLNARFAAQGKPKINIQTVPETLANEDLMEMVNAGILGATVVDDWLAAMWARVLTKLRIHKEAIVRERGLIGWGIRKNNPKLKAEASAYLQRLTRKKIMLRVRQYSGLVAKLKNPTKTSEWKRFKKLYPLFQKYGGKYRFDPLMLAALAYKESTLKQTAKSHVGAIGIMQVLPATAKELGINNIHLVEPNIRAGTKYLDYLIATYFSDAAFNDVNRQLFAFASYNMGPGNLAKMRKVAKAQGLDPNKWFDHVEVATARKRGAATPAYVRTVYKYYIAYKVVEAQEKATEDARKNLTRSVNTERR